MCMEIFQGADWIIATAPILASLRQVWNSWGNKKQAGCNNTIIADDEDITIIYMYMHSSKQCRCYYVFLPFEFWNTGTVLITWN